MDAILAALATLTAAWPISTLLTEPTWLPGVALLLAVIALSGIGARVLALRGWQTLLVQLGCSVLAAGAIYGQGHLWHGLPTFETLRFAGTLLREALKTVQSYAAPAPTTAGLSLVVGCSLAIIALLVDYLALTRRSPSLAGLPLLTAFLAAAANSGPSLPPIFFLAAAAMWLILVARAGSYSLRRWGTTETVPRTPVRQSPQWQEQGQREYASIARMLGAVALVAAVFVPVVLPQLPPTFLASGLGRSSSGHGNGTGTVGFSLSLDLAADLRSQSTTALLQYKTTDPSPPPLRVAVSSLYNSDDGVWDPNLADLTQLTRNPSIPTPTGLSGDVPKTRFAMTFSRNLLDQPHLAAPYPLVSADLGDVDWGLTGQSQDINVARRPDSYEVGYWRLQPSSTMLANTSANPQIDDPEVLDVDLRSFTTITKLSNRLTKGKVSAYDKAMAIQSYLRETGGFTYSLTLAPPSKDQFGNDAGFDPLTNFLVTKQGYCVQFATAMVMMARAAGIPARMAIGFLPGTPAKDVWTVTAAEAHSWPELYLDGIGWTRFEPTPSRGPLPGYAIAPTLPGSTVDKVPGSQSTRAPTTPRKDLGDASGDAGLSPVAGQSTPSLTQRLTHGWGLVLLASLAGLLGSLAVPTAARWRRRRRLLTARTPAERIEVQWELLRSTLEDLGIEPAPSRTPRQQQAYYDREAFLEGADSQALATVLQTLEGSRYAVSATLTDDLSTEARQVVRAAAASRPRTDRVRAALWPSSGVTELRSAGGDIAQRVRSPLRELSARVRKRLPRQESPRPRS